MAHDEIIIRSIKLNESLDITNYGNILCKSKDMTEVCNKNRLIHHAIIPIIAEYNFKSRQSYELKTELTDLLQLSYKILSNAGIDILDPSIEEGYSTKIKLLSEWCTEMSKDHNNFYLFDRIAYGYDVYSHGVKKIPFQEFGSHCTFDNFEKMVSNSRDAIHDMIYEDADFKIIVLTKEGIKRNKRIELNKAIQDSIDTDQFVYCEI